MLNGPGTPIRTPIVFSGGLYNNMPTFSYSGVLKDVSENHTIISSPGPLARIKFEKICDDNQCDKLPLIAHSSLDLSILKSHRLERALLLDPATTPGMGLGGLVPITIQPRAPVDVIISRLYDTFVKQAFQPNIVGANVIQTATGGHCDILDNIWIALGSSIGIPTDENNRDEYKKFISTYINEWAKANTMIIS